MKQRICSCQNKPTKHTNNKENVLKNKQTLPSLLDQNISLQIFWKLMTSQLKKINNYIFYKFKYEYYKESE